MNIETILAFYSLGILGANGLILIANLIAVRLTMKLFTEYKKDVSQDRRMNKE